VYSRNLSEKFSLKMPGLPIGFKPQALGQCLLAGPQIKTKAAFKTGPAKLALDMTWSKNRQ